jgi:hypothetical protein
MNRDRVNVFQPVAVPMLRPRVALQNISQIHMYPHPLSSIVS